MATISNIFLSLTAHLQQDQLPEEEHLKNFADWLRDRAKWTKLEEQEVYKCESEDLHEAITPLFKELKPQKDIGYNVWRMSGVSKLQTPKPAFLVSVRPSPNTNIQGGCELSFGSVTYIKKDVQVNGSLDCVAIFL